MSQFDNNNIVISFADLLSIYAALDEAAHALDNPADYAAALHALAALQNAADIIAVASHEVVTH